jgi:anti-sigma regulatory factor (Ser/Thr protein kinase)
VPIATLTVPSRVEFVRPATSFLVQAARALEVSAAAAPVFEVAISEAITNAVRHGGNNTAGSTITCQLELEGRTLTVRILDDGSGFRLRSAKLPDVSREELDALPASGYGLPIIQAVFPHVRVIDIGGRFGVELALMD